MRLSRYYLLDVKTCSRVEAYQRSFGIRIFITMRYLNFACPLFLMFIHCGSTYVVEGHSAGSRLNVVACFFWFNKYSPYWKISEMQVVDSIEVSILYDVGQPIYWTMGRIWKRSFWFEFHRIDWTDEKQNYIFWHFLVQVQNIRLYKSSSSCFRSKRCALTDWWTQNSNYAFTLCTLPKQQMKYGVRK